MFANYSKLHVHWHQFSADYSEYPETILKVSFGPTKMTAYANKIFVRLFIRKKYGNVYWVDIILSIPYKINTN